MKFPFSKDHRPHVFRAMFSGGGSGAVLVMQGGHVIGHAGVKIGNLPEDFDDA